MADIVIVNPRFEPSFWGLEYALPVFGKRANMAVGALPLLAALTPAEHTVTLVDECVEEIDFDRLARADIVALTGMVVQRRRMTEILTELKRRGAFTAVGGAWVSLVEDYFGDLADVIFVGEAEETWPEFLRDWQAGRHRPRYQQAERSDLTRVPTPRYDLLKTDRYLFGAVQFTRGCPYQCEFCDIIVTFGRRPRLKTIDQILGEMDALYERGVREVFVVDDNLIGNKRAIKEVLRALVPWQEAHHYRTALFTEASLDLAEDDELIDLMVRANMLSVFIGIESPSPASLRETKKYQNVKAGTTILERVHKIQRAGMEVMCGMIVGFDNDDPSIFGAQEEFIRDARIPQAMFGMLRAFPKTPLHDRLRREGRLDESDTCDEFGTNVVPKRMSRAELRDGYLRTMLALYEPKAFLDRLDALYLRAKIPYCPTRMLFRRKHPLEQVRSGFRDSATIAYLFTRLMWVVKDPALRREYRARVVRIAARRDPGLVIYYLIKCAVHYHLLSMAKALAAQGVVGELNTLVDRKAGRGPRTHVPRSAGGAQPVAGS